MLSKQSVLDRPILKEDWQREAGEGNGLAQAPARLHGASDEQKTAGPDAGPWEPTIKKIVEFQHLGDDWDGRGALVPSYEVVVSAIGLAYVLYQQEVEPPARVVPGIEGSIILEW